MFVVCSLYILYYAIIHTCTQYSGHKMELIWDLDSYECHLENGNGQGYSKAYHSKKKTLNLGECVWHVIVRVCLHDTVFK